MLTQRMNLEEELKREHSRRQADAIAAWIGRDAKRFAKLIALFQNGEPLIRQRAGWVVSVVCENHPGLAAPVFPTLLALGSRENEHEAVARNVFKILETIPLPGEFHSQIHELTLRKLSDPKATAAVKAYAITVLRRMTDLYPELLEEARLVLDELRADPSAGAAIRSRLKKEFGL